MIPSINRILCRSLIKRRVLTSISLINQRNYASEWDVEDWGFNYPDTREYASEREKYRIQTRMHGKEIYEPQILFRDKEATEINPNVIPTRGDSRIFGETDLNYIVWHKAKKGELGRCECGFWFKIVDEDIDE